MDYCDPALIIPHIPFHYLAQQCQKNTETQKNISCYQLNYFNDDDDDKNYSDDLMVLKFNEF